MGETRLDARFGEPRSVEDVRESRRVQKQAAWEKSAEVRKRMGILREAMKKGEVDPMRVIVGAADPAIEEVVQGLKILTFLRYLPHIGMVRAVEIITVFDVSPNTRVRALSPERRRELAMIYKGAATAWSP